MKKILLTILFTFFVVAVKAQCNCQNINRGDGTQVTQCQPLMVAYDNSSQLGFAAASNGRDNFVTVTVRFKSPAQKVNSNLTVRLVNNDMVTVDLTKSQLAYIGNSEVAQAIYLVEGSVLDKLQSSNLYTVSFKLEDDMIRTYQVERNSDILVKQLSCI